MQALAIKKQEAPPPGEDDDQGDSAKGAASGVQALTKGFALLNLIYDAPSPMRFSDLLRYSAMPKGTLHRMLQALVDQRFVKLDERTQTYRLGNRLFEMAHKVWSEFDLRSAAEPELERLRQQMKETIRLGILEGEEVLVIDQRDTPQPMRMANGVGSRFPAQASALGKALMAYQPPEKLREFLHGKVLGALTPNTISNPTELKRELELIKARGYAVSVEELHLGVSAVAAPILDHRGEAIGAIGITGPSFRLTSERLHALGRDVIEAARRASGNAGEVFVSISNSVESGHSPDHRVKCAIPSSALLGEGPHWLAASQSLLWVDILSPAVHLSQPLSGDTRFVPLPDLVGVVAPRRRGGYVAATQNGFRALDLQSGQMTTLAAPPSMVDSRFNDGKCDPSGRFWAGTLALDATPDKGVLYCLETDGTLREVERGFHICNGLGWSPDAKRFYLADSGRREIYVYDYALESGTLSNKRVFARFDGMEGVPDGLAVDAQGYVWCAMWDGWSVVRLAPDGSVDSVIRLPVPRPTSCAFGGPEMNILYITSARIRLSALQLAAAPLSGSVLALQTDVAGVPVGDFGG